MTIVTLHTIDKNPETNDVLADVIATMRTMGAPVIRAFYDDCNGIYMAIEGCHRIEAARQLGLVPVIDVMDCGDLDSEDSPDAPEDIVDEMDMGPMTMADLWQKVETWASRARDSQFYSFDA